MRVNNKIKRIVRPQEDLELIFKAIKKNEQHLQSFCARNNMKFPPITQSRYGNFSPLSSICIQPPTGKSDLQRLKKLQSQNRGSQQDGTVQWLQKKASICKIMFSQSDRSKSQNVGVHSGRLFSNSSNQSLLKNLHRAKPRFRSLQKSINLGDLTARHSTLQHFIEGLNFTTQQRQNKAFLSQSIQAGQNQQNRYELLSINRMFTINPEAELMKTLRERNLAFQKSAGETTKRQFHGKDISRISFYKNADGILSPKKNQPLGKKQFSMFEPWQGALQQQDFLQEMDK